MKTTLAVLVAAAAVALAGCGANDHSTADPLHAAAPATLWDRYGDQLRPLNQDTCPALSLTDRCRKNTLPRAGVAAEVAAAERNEPLTTNIENLLAVEVMIKKSADTFKGEFCDTIGSTLDCGPEAHEINDLYQAFVKGVLEISGQPTTSVP
ncbi:hypothetical protein G4X40_16790 [Rhodococcus sp. D2-41]|uniref:hypothetical protein n=1 Tax=Speluncibacter jeojiensis TaxID=2710754 RepID=UPI00240F9EB3|nr:hypothetical protein [Rhodococcus sp. D2-41]MDG3011804.1 hypothetical protein [Rhodococcus sp. D2-41]